jgi:hypothetical protein
MYARLRIDRGQSIAPTTSPSSGDLCGRSRFKGGSSLVGSSAQRPDHIRRNTTLRLFAGISVKTGAENPTDCASAATRFEVWQTPVRVAMAT